MSTTQILEELSQLSARDRELIAQRLCELEEQDALRVCEAAALEGAQLLDRLEAEDAGAPSR